MCYYIFAENFKPKPLEFKIRKFETFMSKTNTANLILTRALTWKLANYYINMSEQNQLNQKNSDASKNIDLAAQQMARFEEINAKMQQPQDGETDELKLFARQKKLQKQITWVQSWREIVIARKFFEKAIVKKPVDLDDAYDSVDAYTRAISRSFNGQQPELEAIASAELGKVFLNALQNNKRAKKHINDCVRILETLKPRVFTAEAWHKEMMQNLNTITVSEKDKEKAEEDAKDAAIREKVVGELADLNTNKKSPEQFLKFIAENYISYQNTKVAFDEAKDFKTSKLRKTIVKTCVFYHPDKQKLNPTLFDEKAVYLRTQISKILTNYLNTLKLPQADECNDDDSTDDEQEEEKTQAEEKPDDTKPQKECKKCDEKCEEKANFCPNCGETLNKPQEKEDVPSSEKEEDSEFFPDWFFN